MGTLLVDGDVSVSTAMGLWPFQCPLAWPLAGNFLRRGGFFFSPKPREQLSKRFRWTEGKVFAFMRLLRNFQWYDFASIFVYGKV